MNAKHTSGPWIAIETRGQSNDWPGAFGILAKRQPIGSTKISDICTVWERGGKVKTNANAALIAAAPDLLAALQESETFCAAILSTIPLEDTSTRNRLAAQRKVIRAAIAKAT